MYNKVCSFIGTGSRLQDCHDARHMNIGQEIFRGLLTRPYILYFFVHLRLNHLHRFYQSCGPRVKHGVRTEAPGGEGIEPGVDVTSHSSPESSKVGHACEDHTAHWLSSVLTFEVFNRPSFHGLLELRSACRKLRDKLEHTFRSSFKLLFVDLSPHSLQGLLDISRHKTFRAVIQGLVFHTGKPLLPLRLVAELWEKNPMIHLREYMEKEDDSEDALAVKAFIKEQSERKLVQVSGNDYTLVTKAGWITAGFPSRMVAVALAAAKSVNVQLHAFGMLNEFGGNDGIDWFKLKMPQAQLANFKKMKGLYISFSNISGKIHANRTIKNNT
ncbi:hypothetical protein K469DRAFT_691791 [Zopfia rhizophila CBS 207.26]|uniref:Uncharacterized protein n=1 Tax=Zopfia rhizophila CBS 207.26 TaxID=1314779 RepID=A0A6A6DUN2_9PEZI|nr:hypothetical protein K469DRAFT_691791 [Zopfia rhizophila CBS 207.26]